MAEVVVDGWVGVVGEEERGYLVVGLETGAGEGGDFPCLAQVDVDFVFGDYVMDEGEVLGADGKVERSAGVTKGVYLCAVGEEEMEC